MHQPSTLLLAIAAVMFSSSAISAAPTGIAARPSNDDLLQAADTETLPVAVEAVDLPLEAYRLELLAVAFDSAGAMPTMPHVKNRSRAQEKVVGACLLLDLPQKATDYAEQITNWRRGTSLADCAFYCARVGAREQALRLVERAGVVAANPNDSTGQEWRVERIQAKIARVRWYLGQVERGADLELSVTDSALRELAEIRASGLNDSGVDSLMARLDEYTRRLGFDEQRAVMDVFVKLFGRFYDELELRNRIERKLRSMWASFPLHVQYELVVGLIETALVHQDPKKALSLIDGAMEILEGRPWDVEERIAMQAKLGKLRFEAGDEERARLELRSALAIYDSSETSIVDIQRADALRPLAEAYHGIGERQKARELYQRALLVGVENPNSRPRSEDLAETCTSMALQAFEPDDELWALIRRLRGLLGEPW